MSGHWADAYVGIEPEGQRPCWSLVRRVWIEQLQFWMPGFDETDDPERAVAQGEVRFEAVPPGQQREFDAVMMLVPMRVPEKGPRAWRLAETHIGVLAAPGLVLHAEIGRPAAVEPLRAVKVSRILRGPWTANVGAGGGQ